MRTLDDIIPPSRRSQPAEPPPDDSPRPVRPRRARFPLGTTLVVLLIIAASVGTLFYFSSAEVKVTPLARTASMTATPFTALGTTGDLTYEIVTVEKVASQTVTSSGTKAASASAQGSLTIYNTQKVAQKLRATTRFQTSNGLVFKIGPEVTVPAAVGGVPGSLSVKVTAAQPGSQYNIGPTSFTLPGLAGSPQFTAVTAKSTGPMSGGASGNEPAVAKEIEQATRTALMDSLRADLATALKSQLPQGYVLLTGASDISFAELPTTPGTSADTALLKEQGTLRGIALPGSALAKALASASFEGGYKGEPVTLGDTASLALKPSAALPASNQESFAFTLSGSVKIISKVDGARISAAVAGKSRSSAEVALRQYPEVKIAILILRPFWRETFPDDPSSIKVEVLAPTED